MNEEDLKQRTKQYALRIIKFQKTLPHTPEGRVVANQIIRCGTAVGANYRAACRARSLAEFVAKIGIVIEEADESAFWIEIAIEAGIVERKRVELLLQETNEIVAIMVSSVNSAKKKNETKSKI